MQPLSLDGSDFVKESLAELSDQRDERGYTLHSDSKNMVTNYHNKQYRKTLALAEKVCLAYPDWEMGYFWKGMALLAMNNKREAVAAWMNGIARSKQISGFCEALSDHYLKQEMYSWGMIWLFRCLQLQIKRAEFNDVRPFLTLAYLMLEWSRPSLFEVFKKYSGYGSHGVIDFNHEGRKEITTLARNLTNKNLKAGVLEVAELLCHMNADQIRHKYRKWNS